MNYRTDNYAARIADCVRLVRHICWTTFCFTTMGLFITKKRLLTIILGSLIMLLYFWHKHVSSAFNYGQELWLFRTSDVRVLLWTHFHTPTLVGRLEHQQNLHRECPQGSCQFTHQRTLLHESDAVVFDVREPQLVSDTVVNVPDIHPNGQYWILYNHEAMNLPSAFYNALPGGVFNLSATYARGADIHLPYGMCEPRRAGNFTLPDGFPSNKSGLVVWHVSHCTDRSLRMSYVKRLQNFIEVDILGKCGQELLQDKRIRVGRDMSSVAKENINKYKFYLAFENTYCKDYITEKVFKIIQDDIYTVPIVRGSGPYKDILPPGSYINAADFDGPLKLAQYLNKLDNNDTMYKEYFKARRNYQCHNYSSNKQDWLCMICDKVATLKRARTVKVVDNADMKTFFHKRKNCYNPDSIKDKKIQSLP